MASRRSSARIRGDAVVTQAGGPSGGGGGAASKKRAAAGGTMVEGVFGEPDKMKRTPAKKQQTFKPQRVAVHSNSSDTSPDEGLPLPPPLALPPPPSEKKIARRRESTRAIRERSSDSPPAQERIKAGRSSVKSGKPPSRRPDPPLASLATHAGSASASSGSRGPRHIDFLNFSISQLPKPSAPTPMSPTPMSPPRPSRPSRISKVPPTEPFVRKTRKSMRGLGAEDVSGETVVPIPEKETPMIRKNKDLREAQRRSSFGMRGQRASSSLGKGEISIPHPTVESATFWKHITPTLPEPIRARHLLVWCAKRALDERVAPTSGPSKGKSKGKAKSEVRADEGDRLVKEIMEEFIANLGKGLVDTNVFSQPNKGTVGSAVLLRPHSKNTWNRQVVAEAEGVIKRSKEESSQWSVLVHGANRRQTEIIEQLHTKRANNEDPKMSNVPTWMAHALKVTNKVVEQGEGDSSAMGEFADVEYKVETLHQTVHTCLQFSRQASRFLDGIFSSLIADLRNRERLGIPSLLPPADTSGLDPVGFRSSTKESVTAAASSSTAGGVPSRPDPMAMLRALVAADAKQWSGEPVAAAVKVAPMLAMPSTAMTPQESGSDTPKRQDFGNRYNTEEECLWARNDDDARAR